MNTSMATRPARAATGRASAASRQRGSRAGGPLFEPLESRRVLSTLYVSTTGSDTNPGTADAPWRTLQYAVDVIAPGDTVLVKSGTYAGFRAGKSGTSGAPKAIKADAGATVLINTPSPLNKHASNVEVELFGGIVTDWVLEGFEVANATRYGIDIRNTQRITIRGNHVHHAAVTGIFTAFSDDPVIVNNTSSSNGEHGIYHSNSGDRPVIQGNTLFGNYGCGIHMNGDASMKPGDGLISNAVVANNVISENGRGGGSAINLDGVMDSVIRNNLAYQNHASGISLFAINGAAGSSRNQVLNNTFVMASDGRWVVNMPASAKGKANPTGNRFQNNILYTPRSDRGSILVWSSGVNGFFSDDNVVVNRFSVDGGKRIITQAQWRTYGYDTRSIQAVPVDLVVNPGANDYRLKAGSAAIDRGATLTLVPTDITGTARSQGSAYDIGCYEYQSSVTTASASTRVTASGGALVAGRRAAASAAPTGRLAGTPAGSRGRA